MSRNSTQEALVLAVREQGENNRSVTLLSPQEGILYATLYGGAKSKMRSLVSPFNRGRIWLYKDEVRHSVKITDFDVQSYHLSFRESLFKSWAATLAAETVIKTKCAGSPAECWRLTNGFLDGMELSSERESRLGLIRFIWRYLALSGIKPRTDRCLWCGASFHAAAVGRESLQHRAFYDEGENGFICADCLEGSGEKRGSQSFFPSPAAVRTFTAGKAALTYLEAISDLEPKAVRAIPLDGATVTELKSLCYHLLEAACGSRLSALDSGLGIL